MIRLGGWLLVLACALWLGIYWHRLDSGERMLGIGVPTLLLNGFGWYARRRAPGWRGSAADSRACVYGWSGSA